jgi:hypothetical protein
MRRQPVFTLRRTGPRKRNQLRQIAVALTVLREQNQPECGRAIGIAQLKIRTDDKRQPRLFRRDMGAHNARERAFVGDGQSLVT